MKCEWAEGYLSAYLDNTLDPPLRAEVSEHLASCERCSAILADYRRYDALLADAVRITPPDSLRDRIFSSPEFATILQSSSRQAERSASQSTPLAKPTLGPRWRTPASPFPLTPTTADTPDATPGETPAVSEAPTEDTDTPSTDAPARVPVVMPIRPTRRLPIEKILLPVAAALILALGVSALFRAEFGPSGASRSQNPGQIVGAPNFSTAPLSAGPRLVYAHDGALWSAPEVGVNGAPIVAQRLTPPSVDVVAWSVSPIANGQGGAWIVYVDGKTGALHLVRSDRQQDQIIGAVAFPSAKGHPINPAFWSSALGRAALANLSWSPNGQQIAYMQVETSSATVTVNVGILVQTNDPANPVIMRSAQAWAAIGSAATHLAWSADSAWLAVTQAPLGAGATGVHGVWLYHVTTNVSTQLAMQADPQHPTATVTQLAIAQSGGQTIVTWAASDGPTITGVFAQPATASAATTPTRLTPDGAAISAADVTTSGEWLIANGNALETISALAPAGTTPQTVATLGAPAQAIKWSPTGAIAAIVSQGALSLWSPTAGVTPVATGVGAAPALAWSPDGQRLAFVTSDNVTSALVPDGRAAGLTALGHAAQTATLLWSPDGRLLAIAASNGTQLAAVGGPHATQIATYPADGGALAWSIAG